MELKIPATLRITNPRWVEKLESRKTWDEVNSECEVKGRKLSIGDYQCCIVGEALNLFDVNWGESHIRGENDVTYHKNCNICAGASMNLFRDIEDLGYDRGDVEELEKDLQKFAKHLEEEHPEYIEEARIRNAH